MKINILGTSYDLVENCKEEDPQMKDCDGYCDETVKKCAVIGKFEDDPNNKADLNKHRQKLIRHELIHAFLFESGLAESSEWAQNEEMVDWIAFQFPKLLKAFEQAGAFTESKQTNNLT